VALALGLGACQHGFQTLFLTAHALSSQLMEARDEKRLLKLQAQMQTVKLLIIDELGYVPLSQVGAPLADFHAAVDIAIPIERRVWRLHSDLPADRDRLAHIHRGEL
jgi:IstB-like ATP binding protein